MKLFLIASVIALTCLQQAHAADAKPAKGMMLLNNGVAVPRESVEALQVIAHQNFLIQEFEAELEGHHQGLALHKKIGFENSQWNEAHYQKAIADSEKKIADAKALKVKIYGPDVDKLQADFQEKAVRLGDLLAEEKASGKKSAALLKLEGEVQELGKNLVAGQKKYLTEAAKLAKAAARSKVARAGIVAVPIAAAAVVAGAGSDQAEASELHELAQPEDAKQEEREDVTISELGTD